MKLQVRTGVGRASLLGLHGTPCMRAAAAAWVVSLATSAALAQAPNWEKLRIGVEGNYPPFSQMGVDGKLSGFDIDIARAICAELKADCKLVQQEWDGMMPALNARKFDAIVASMTMTDERRKAVLFSDAYYDVPSLWVAKAGAFKDASEATFKGKKIIVLRNSPRAAHVTERFKGNEVLLVAKEADVYLELAAGRGDIALGSSVVATEAFLKLPAGKGFAAVGQPLRIGEDGAGGSAVGIAMRKGDVALKDKINTALKAIRANGSYKALAAKYFDFDVSPR